jgi:transcription antitermination factor NusA-like protein
LASGSGSIKAIFYLTSAVRSAVLRNRNRPLCLSAKTAASAVVAHAEIEVHVGIAARAGIVRRASAAHAGIEVHVGIARREIEVRAHRAGIDPRGIVRREIGVRVHRVQWAIGHHVSLVVRDPPRARRLRAPLSAARL